MAFSFLPVLAQASVSLDTRIHDVVIPKNEFETLQVLSTVDGRVYEVAPEKTALIDAIRDASSAKQPLRLTIEADAIIDARSLSAEEALTYEDILSVRESQSSAEEAASQEFLKGMEMISAPNGLPYQATNLSSMDEAQYHFSQFTNLSSRSQCFQRAHYWAREMYVRSNIYSMKVFLFFTRKFIREHKYKWWFHVAPYVYVQGREVVLDPEFVMTAQELFDWTSFFMMDARFVKPPLYSKPTCSEVSKYSQYENNQESQLCYVLKLPMYYYQPLDAENLDANGAQVTSFRKWDVENSKKAESSSWWPF